MTPLPRKLFVVGSGGFGREVAWLASSIRSDVELQFVVDRPEYLTPDVAGISVRLLADLRPEADGAHYVVAIGDPQARKRLANLMECSGFTATSLVHPSVQMSERVAVGVGSILAAGSILTVDIEVGRHSQVHVGCAVGHDAVIGDFSTLCPGVRVSGNVRIGNGVFLGVGAVIINGSPGKPLTIGDHAVIAAGACVTKDVEPDTMVAGVPATRRH